ncbi:hypothetical protein ACFYO8_10685 [Micromonospora sp. NPDC005257]|uniref:hypothetical protein n=1 Tax=Micromonospora sp. NPDC005257 TaxID=3364230 RepID=UPI0036B05ACD
MADKHLSVTVTSRKLKCKAKSKRTGNQCGRWAVNGATVCPMHGAAKGTPARLKAEEQLKAARDELMELLLGIARDADLSASDRLKAITWALERAGFKGGVDVAVSVNPAWREVLEGIWDDDADDAAESPAALPAAGRPALSWEPEAGGQPEVVHIGELMPQRRATNGRARLR